MELHETTELSYKEIANKLVIKNSALIASWKKKFEEKGVSGLDNNRGRPRMKEKPDSPKKNLDDSVQEDLEKKVKELEYENRLLKIKTEYLEALRSLNQEEMKLKQESFSDSEDNID